MQNNHQVKMLQAYCQPQPLFDNMKQPWLHLWLPHGHSNSILLNNIMPIYYPFELPFQNISSLLQNFEQLLHRDNSSSQGIRLHKDDFVSLLDDTNRQLYDNFLAHLVQNKNSLQLHFVPLHIQALPQVQNNMLPFFHL